jgi:hypothetical protein
VIAARRRVGEASLGLAAVEALGRVSAILSGLVRKHRT